MSEVLDGAWIYVMMTSSDYNRFKVGRTRDNPLNRVRHLRTGDPYLALEAAYFVPTAHGHLSRIESAIHGELTGRIAFYDGSPSEWFRGTAVSACEWIESTFEGWWEPISGAHRIGTGTVVKAYEEDLLFLYRLSLPPHPFDALPM